MAEPVIISYARGLLAEFPGVPEGIIDVIPVDLVVGAICAAAAQPPPEAPHVIQAASGTANPLRYRQLVKLVEAWFTEHPLYENDGQPIAVPEWGFPGRGKVEPAWVGSMARDAIVFACANPVPEIWPWAAHEAGARIVATGRGDFPNQVNNSLCFPAVFRGVLDVRARTITEAMAIAAAHEVAAVARERGLSAQSIVPRMDDPDLYPRVAAATALAAQRDGVARLELTRDALIARARKAIASARDATEALMRAGVIAQPPAK